MVSLAQLTESGTAVPQDPERRGPVLPVDRTLARVAHVPASGRLVMLELDELRIEAESCTRCPLARTRTNVVFGVGEYRERALLREELVLLLPVAIEPQG